MPFDITTTAPAELIGIGGFCLYVTTYTLQNLRVISGHSLRYMCMNLTASSSVLIGLTSSFNLAAAMIQIFWITISLIGIALHVRRCRKSRSETGGSPAHGVNA
ncbi:CBU_0592 family membrane protein [Sulfitobacter sp.]|uniref:CBU_0592 family membrane protein n=1 Tax=Sulfitobacter sp. TaxID=1903071 RepID=UPI003FCD97C9